MHAAGTLQNKQQTITCHESKSGRLAVQCVSSTDIHQGGVGDSELLNDMNKNDIQEEEHPHTQTHKFIIAMTITFPKSQARSLVSNDTFLHRVTGGPAQPCLLANKSTALRNQVTEGKNGRT